MNWDKYATLYHRFPQGEQPHLVQKICSGPMWTIIAIARQGYEGPLENMVIETNDGNEFTGEDIDDLGKQHDRLRKT